MNLTFRPFRFDDADYRTLEQIRAGEDSQTSLKAAGLREYDDCTRAAGKQVWRVIAEVDGQPAGSAMYRELQHRAHPGRRLAWISVHPDHRRRGIAGALWERLHEAGRSDEVKHYMAEVQDPSAGLALARGLGFVDGERLVEHTVNPQEVDPAALGPGVAALASKGITITSLAELKTSCADWLERVYELFCDIHERIPASVAFVPPPMDAFVRTDLEGEHAAHDFYLVARAPSGEWVGSTELRYQHGDTRVEMEQWLTGTRSGWTRRGIATGLKAAIVLRAREAGVTSIWTITSTRNPAMSIASERAGFVASGAYVNVERREP